MYGSENAERVTEKSYNYAVRSLIYMRIIYACTMPWWFKCLFQGSSFYMVLGNLSLGRDRELLGTFILF